MKKDRAGCRSYLLRMWPEQVGGEWIWRFSLEAPDRSGRKGFTSLVDLCCYLKQAMEPARRETLTSEADHQELA